MMSKAWFFVISNDLLVGLIVMMTMKRAASLVPMSYL